MEEPLTTKQKLRKIFVNKYVMTKLGNLKQVSATSTAASQIADEARDVTTVTEVIAED